MKEPILKNNLVKLGYDAQYRIPIFSDFSNTGHLCCIGSTNSGKSMAVLYFLYNLLKTVGNVELWIGDFKKSGDYKGLSENFSEFNEITNLVEDFYTTFEATSEDNKTIKLLLIEEYAAYITWLAQNDKKNVKKLKVRYQIY